ncbi:LysR family transcriptional regulator [uncultured Ilyobacter sp.]|jgi:DNA-binding transcriptional LysR family regulator|uniref:LysR family transcriptional regulator n=1 Tax=uncultured Ilyobacter sp. TaxID=544433 RepID=UPI0029BFE21A|nr:LysR family transcriptional regulator [uncultured Ilyobacter sp.]
MDIRQLKYFMAIVEEGNITKAAEKLHMAQPPLSYQLKLMEEELGVKLLERSTRKLEITEAGEMLKTRSEQIIELFDKTVKDIKNFREGFTGTLSMGVVASSMGIIYPKFIQEYHEAYPDTSFDIREGNTNRILEFLKNGVIELGIVRTPFNSENFDSIQLPNEPMIAVTKPKGVFIWDKKKLNADDLKDLPLILDRRFEKMIIKTCQQNGYSPKILCESEDTRTILSWVDIGMGVGVVPKSSKEFVNLMNLEYKEIEEFSLETGTSIVWVRDRRLSEAASNFLQIFKKITQ